MDSNKTPKYRHSKSNNNNNIYVNNSNYDTILKKYDTKYLYKVGKIYYYRRRYKTKLIRISLRTSDICIAINLKHKLDKLKGCELFKLTLDDYSAIEFEYDTIDEFNHLFNKSTGLLNKQKELHQTAQMVQQNVTNTHVIRFFELEHLFIDNKKHIKNVSDSSIKQYHNTFNKLNDYFGNKSINQISFIDFENFRDYLSSELGLNAKTVNGHLQYTSNFLDFALHRSLIAQN